MALLKFKRSAVPAKIPALNDLALGELAINTYDGKVYTKKDDGTPAIVEIGGNASGITTITSTDGSVTVTGSGATRDLSVAVAGSTTNVLALVRNNTGATLAKGTVVYINGSLGQNSTVAKAIANSDATSAQTLGLMTANLANNATGYVTVIGVLTGMDTSAFTDGQQLYLSPTTAGTFTATKPYAPNHLVYVAVVEHAHPSQGKLFVKVQNGYEMDELHDVSAQNPANNDGLFYNTSTSLWEKKSIPTALGYTPANKAGDTFNGVVSIYSSNDAQLYLNGNGTSWAGMSWADASGSDYIWYNGSTSTFAIGGGGSYVANKKLHVHGGMTIGSGLAMSASGTNSLSVEASITANQIYSQIFYDSQNGAYYVDPASTSNLNALTLGGRATDFAVYYAGFTLDANTMPSNSTGFTYANNAPFVGPVTRLGHGAYDLWFNAPYGGGGRLAFRTRNGDTAAINAWQYPALYDQNVNGGGALYATTYYDQSNTNYYCDPASTSVLNVVAGYSLRNIEDVSVDTPYGIYFSSNFNADYAIHRESGAWSHPYPDLRIAFHTGIKIGAAAGYNGVRFYDNSNMLTQVMSVNNGSDALGTGNVYVNNSLQAGSSLRAPIFYDSNDTSYYLDPNSTSVLNAIQPWGEVGMRRGDSATLLRSYNTSAGQPTQFYVNHNLGEVEIGNARGIVYAGGSYWQIANSVRAPIFYDSNDTTYYIDPAGNGTRAGYLNGNLWINPKSESYGEGVTFYMPNQATWGGLRWYRNGSAGGYAGNWAFGYFGNESTNDIGFHNGVNGWRLDQSFNNTVNGSFRAPIFYDSNDTGYYVDPTGTSFTNVMRGDKYHSLYNGGQPSPRWDNSFYVLQSQHWYSHNGTSTMYVGESGDFVYIRGYTTAEGSSRSPIFYDSNNTGFYVDPNSASRLERLVLSARYDNYFVGSMAVVNAVNNFQTLTDTFGQMNVMQVSDTGGFTNAPTGLYPYGGVMSWRTENHSYQMYASHTGDLAYKTQWNNDNYSGWQTPVIYGRIGNSASGRSIYGSVYYDTDNTGYFLNPTGTSTLANLDVASVIDSAAYYDAAIEIRERAFGGALTTSLNNAPRLAFHWGGRVAMQLVLDSGGTFNVMNGDTSGYSGLASGNFTANGSITATGNVTAYSDIRIKANVETIPSALEKVDLIRGVTYTRTDLDDKEQRYAGVIAQEIEAVLPEAVRDLGNIKAVDYNATIALLIEAVKELALKVKTLEEKDN